MLPGTGTVPPAQADKQYDYMTGDHRGINR
jgi:hypothetical protein